MEAVGDNFTQLELGSEMGTTLALAAVTEIRSTK